MRKNNTTVPQHLWLVIIAAALAGGFILSGCERQGPLERAGERGDRALEDVGEEIERAGEEIRDTARGDR